MTSFVAKSIQLYHAAKNLSLKAMFLCPSLLTKGTMLYTLMLLLAKVLWPIESPSADPPI